MTSSLNDQPDLVNTNPSVDLINIALLIIAISVVLMPIGGMIVHERLMSIGAGSDLPATRTALTWVFLGLLMIGSLIFGRFKIVIGLIVIAGSISAWYLDNTFFNWESQRSNLLLLGTLLTLLGGGLCLLTDAMTRKSVFRLRTLDLVVATAGVGLSITMACLLIDRDAQNEQRSVRMGANLVAREIQLAMDKVMRQINRQVLRWDAFEFQPPELLIDREFANYMSDSASFLGVAYIANHLQTVRVSTRNIVEKNWWIDFIDSSSNREWLRHIQGSGKLHVRAVPMAQEKELNILFAVPLVDKHGQYHGFIMVLASLENLLNIDSRTDRIACCVEVLMNGDLLYKTFSKNIDQQQNDVTVDVLLHNHSKLHVRYSQDMDQPNSGLGALPEISLVAGLLFTLFSGTSCRLFYLSRRRSEQLRHHAQHDVLTGLPNRRMLERLLSTTAQSSKSTGADIYLISIIIDDIRTINDSLGHRIGDMLLIEVAERLKQEISADTQIAKLDGGEFVVCITGSAHAAVEAHTADLIKSIERPYYVSQSVHKLTAFAGIAVSHAGRDISDPMVLLREADLAVLESKKEGVSIYWFDDALKANITERLFLRKDLQTALDKGQLDLHYQPIVSSTTGEVVYLEALMRWQHSELGLVPPARFIPIAEETGWIVALTDWSLRKACQDIERMELEGMAAVPIAVNISPIYFERKDFDNRIRELIETTGISPDMLILELTEGIFLKDLSEAVFKLLSLREMGIQTALDDFGTGFSSLSYLNKLPISKIKLDRSFIVDIAAETADQTVVKGVVDIAHGLGLSTIAEGVESAEQFILLKQLGCDMFQGYLFARPVRFQDLFKSIESASMIFNRLPKQ